MFKFVIVLIFSSLATSSVQALVTAYQAGPSICEEEEFEKLMLDCKDGSASAQYRIAKIYHYGAHSKDEEWVLCADRESALDFYREAAISGSRKSLFALYHYLRESPDPALRNEAILSLKKSADAGYPLANRILGLNYQHAENGFEQNLKQAIKHLKDAVEAKDIDSFYLLGDLYNEIAKSHLFKGELDATSTYRTLSMDVFCRGSNLGCHRCMFEHGCFLFKRNKIRKAKKLIIAVTHSVRNMEELVNLGRNLLRAADVKRGTKTKWRIEMFHLAGDCFKMANNRKHPSSYFELAKWFESGPKGNFEQLKRAINIYAEGAALGCDLCAKTIFKLPYGFFQLCIEVPH